MTVSMFAIVRHRVGVALVAGCVTASSGGVAEAQEPAPVPRTPRVAPVPRPARAPEAARHLERLEQQRVVREHEMAAVREVRREMLQQRDHLEALGLEAMQAARMAAVAEAQALAEIRMLHEQRAVLAPLAQPPLDARPRAPWAQNDPADSLYRRARELLNAGANAEAATLFARIASAYPNSTYAPDALYWEAFARYRTGRADQLRLALASLERQRTRYPRASTGSDAAALATRIRGALASGGDENAARALRGQIAPTAPPRPAAAPIPAVAPTPTPAPATRPAAPSRPAPSPRPPTAAGTPAAVRAARAATAHAAPQAARAPRATPSNCDAADQAVRIEALNALGKMESTNIGPTVNAVLARRDECSAGLRRQALILLTRQGSPEAWAQLRRSATSDPDASVRRQAVNWLGRAPADVAVAALGDLMRTGDERTQRDALAALASVDDPRARQLVRDVVMRTDASESLRVSAIDALGKGGHGENAAWLRQAYPRLDTPRLRDRALAAIGRADDPASDRWLRSVGGDPEQSPHLRAYAIAQTLRPESDVAEVIALYDSSRGQMIRSAVIRALAARTEPAATDKLLAIARQDEDAALRRLAITVLAKKKDPRTERLLLDIIDP